MNSDDTVPFSFKVTRIAPVKGRGRLLAIAHVAVEVAGIEIILQGFTVRRQGQNIVAEGPRYRGEDGVWYPALILPDGVLEAIAHQIWAEMNPSHESA